jgi:hypothetical protein
VISGGVGSSDANGGSGRAAAHRAALMLSLCIVLPTALLPRLPPLVSTHRKTNQHIPFPCTHLQRAATPTTEAILVRSPCLPCNGSFSSQARRAISAVLSSLGTRASLRAGTRSRSLFAQPRLIHLYSLLLLLSLVPAGSSTSTRNRKAIRTGWLIPPPTARSWRRIEIVLRCCWKETQTPTASIRSA